MNWLQIQNKPALFTDLIFSDGFALYAVVFLNEWRERPLESVYAVVFLDASVFLMDFFNLYGWLVGTFWQK